MDVPDIRALKAINWLFPWEAFPDVEPRTEGRFTGYDLELVREVGPKHPLFSYKERAIPIAVRGDCDDRLYWIPDGKRPFAMVHLTWAGEAQQSSADYPSTEFYCSLEEWIEHSVKRDHDLLRGSNREGSA